MKKAIAFSALFCFLFTANAQAKDVWQMAESPKYGEKLGGMLGRGLLNVATCFVDMPVQMVEGAKESKPEFIGAVGGFAKGATCTVLRAGSGVIDVATSWVPGFNGLPVSRSYKNCLDFGTGGSAPAQSYTAPQATLYQGGTSNVVPAESRMKYVKK
jgi:putative exosortase-associated protein (TIGR04073 family)